MIVLGGSAGGIQSLCKVIEGLPPDLPAALLAVIHMFEGGSHLSQVLQRCGSIQVVVPDPAEPVAAGRLYLPLPNHHLVVGDGCVATAMGPRESRHRPSVNLLFRCVARAYRGDVIGVILSGALDDGATGVMAIKARGGVVIIEDPATAEVPGSRMAEESRWNFTERSRTTPRHQRANGRVSGSKGNAYPRERPLWRRRGNAVNRAR